MAFAFTIDVHTYDNGLHIIKGRYVNDTLDTGGDIVTGLHKIYVCNLQQTKSAVIANEPVVNETMPLDGGTVTIITDANEDGTFEIIGEA